MVAWYEAWYRAPTSSSEGFLSYIADSHHADEFNKQGDVKEYTELNEKGDVKEYAFVSTLEDGGEFSDWAGALRNRISKLRWPIGSPRYHKSISSVGECISLLLNSNVLHELPSEECKPPGAMTSGTSVLEKQRVVLEGHMKTVKNHVKEVRGEGTRLDVDYDSPCSIQLVQARDTAHEAHRTVGDPTHGPVTGEGTIVYIRHEGVHTYADGRFSIIKYTSVFKTWLDWFRCFLGALKGRTPTGLTIVSVQEGDRLGDQEGDQVYKYLESVLFDHYLHVDFQEYLMRRLSEQTNPAPTPVSNSASNVLTVSGDYSRLGDYKLMTYDEKAPLCGWMHDRGVCAYPLWIGEDGYYTFYDASLFPHLADQGLPLFEAFVVSMKIFMKVHTVKLPEALGKLGQHLTALEEEVPITIQTLTWLKGVFRRYSNYRADKLEQYLRPGVATTLELIPNPSGRNLLRFPHLSENDQRFVHFAKVPIKDAGFVPERAPLLCSDENDSDRPIQPRFLHPRALGPTVASSKMEDGEVRLVKCFWVTPQPFYTLMRKEMRLFKSPQGKHDMVQKHDILLVKYFINLLGQFYNALSHRRRVQSVKVGSSGDVAAHLAAFLFGALFDGNDQNVFAIFVKLLKDGHGVLERNGLSPVEVATALAVLEELQQDTSEHFNGDKSIPKWERTARRMVAESFSNMTPDGRESHAEILFQTMHNKRSDDVQSNKTPHNRGNQRDPYYYRRMVAKLNVYTYSACSLLTLKSRIRVVTSTPSEFPLFFNGGREEYKILNGCTVFNIYRSFAAERYEKNLHVAGLFNFAPRENVEGGESLYTPMCSTDKKRPFYSDNVASFVLFNHLSPWVSRMYESYCSRLKSALLTLLGDDLWSHIVPNRLSYECDRYRAVEKQIVQVVSDMQGLQGNGDLLHKRLRRIEWSLLMKEAELKMGETADAVRPNLVHDKEEFLPVSICQVPFARVLVEELRRHENGASLINVEDASTWPVVSQTCARMCWELFQESFFSDIEMQHGEKEQRQKYQNLIHSILDDTHLQSTLNMSKHNVQKVQAWKTEWLEYLNRQEPLVDSNDATFQTMIWTCVIFSCIYPFQILPSEQTDTAYFSEKMGFVREMTFSILSANIVANLPGFVVDNRWKNGISNRFRRSRLRAQREGVVQVKDVSKIRKSHAAPGDDVYEVFDKDALGEMKCGRLQYSQDGRHFLLVHELTETDVPRSQRLYRLADTCVYLIDAYKNSKNTYGVVYIAYLMRAIKVFLPTSSVELPMIHPSDGAHDKFEEFRLHVKKRGINTSFELTDSEERAWQFWVFIATGGAMDGVFSFDNSKVWSKKDNPDAPKWVALQQFKWGFQNIRLGRSDKEVFDSFVRSLESIDMDQTPDQARKWTIVKKFALKKDVTLISSRLLRHFLAFVTFPHITRVDRP